MTTVENALSKAQAAVSDLPQEYRTAAFAEVLRYFLQEASIPPGSEGLLQAVDRNGSVEPGLHMATLIDLPSPATIKRRGTRKQQVAWAAVTVEQRGHAAVTTDTIRAAIRDELGLTPPSATNTAGTMQELVPEFFRRTREGRGYVYHATESIPNLFEGLQQ